MKPIAFPKLTLPESGSGVAPTLGHPLVDVDQMDQTWSPAPVLDVGDRPGSDLEDRTFVEVDLRHHRQRARDDGGVADGEREARRLGTGRPPSPISTMPRSGVRIRVSTSSSTTTSSAMYRTTSSYSATSPAPLAVILGALSLKGSYLSATAFFRLSAISISLYSRPRRLR